MIRLAAIALLTIAFASNAVAQGAFGGDVYTFVADVTIPDGTVLKPGQAFAKTWRLRNSGSTTWNSYTLAFRDGAQMGAPPFVAVPTTQPGATADITVPMVAPADAGAHRGYWQMRAADGRAFGLGPFIAVVVESSTVGGRTFEDWERDLLAQSPTDRRTALAALRRFGPTAVPSLVRTLRSDTDEETRVLALGAIADVSPTTDEAIEAFLVAATDPNPMMAEIAVMLIQEALPKTIRSESVPVLVAAMRDVNPTKRLLAIRLAAGLGPAAKVAAPTLRELAEHDPMSGVRTAAVDALKLVERRGTVSAGTYTSAQKLFSVQVPRPSNFAGVPFAIRDEDTATADAGRQDCVVFEVREFGEVLVAGLRRDPGAIVDGMSRDEKRGLLSDRADRVLSKWRKFPAQPEVTEEAFVATPHGESLLRFYRAEKGSLIARARGRIPTASDRLDAVVAVIVAIEAKALVFAIAESDFDIVGPNAGKEALKRRIQTFFASISANP